MLSVPKRLEIVGKGLMRWAGKLRKRRVGKIRELEERMVELEEEEPIDIILGDLIEIKLDLNMEIDRTELY